MQNVSCLLRDDDSGECACRVSALFNNERVHCEALTDYVAFLDQVSHDLEAMRRAARLLKATKLAIAALIKEAGLWRSATPPATLPSASFAPWPLRDPGRWVWHDAFLPCPACCMLSSAELGLERGACDC